MLKSSISSLYIHIPFCTSKCGYCAFNSFSGLEDLKDAYVCALIQDIQESLKDMPSLKTIFVGGGTPNTLEVKHYEAIFNAIATHAKLAPNIEITLEANPDLLNRAWCAGLKALGATRLSIGVQSFFKDKLEFLQRTHNHQEICQALDTAYKSGFENLSIDLIYNTPLDTKERLMQEIQQASKLPTNHLSAYSLTLEENTKLSKSVCPQDLLQLDSFLKTQLEMHGFRHYEVSNYARNYQCRHNLAYWQGLEYLGCGAGAVGRSHNQRFFKNKDIRTYMAKPSGAKIEVLSPQDLWFERVFLGLRCVVGVDYKILRPAQVQTLLEEQICNLYKGQLTAKDFFLADEIALWLEPPTLS
ncbi:radical SAM family heme chaperone HemW [Helicobacter bizzozeronii]|uniref:radical SAM family heme chaperone HemW n=1 Tax=Helicobacter bizzozeronii TaxID=56877 RepID=UPI000CEE9734|nr:radical SAM family heme chaperone HemW [Helicobacter bizzozeronii]